MINFNWFTVNLCHPTARQWPLIINYSFSYLGLMWLFPPSSSMSTLYHCVGTLLSGYFGPYLKYPSDMANLVPFQLGDFLINDTMQYLVYNSHTLPIDTHTFIVVILFFLVCNKVYSILFYSLCVEVELSCKLCPISLRIREIGQS